MTRLRTLQPTLRTVSTAAAKPQPKVATPFYHSREWLALRDQIRRSRPAVCVMCGRGDRRLWVDHIREIRDGGPPLDPSNLQLLCASCHTAKTVAERAKRMAAA